MPVVVVAVGMAVPATMLDTEARTTRCVLTRVSVVASVEVEERRCLAAGGERERRLIVASKYEASFLTVLGLWAVVETLKQTKLSYRYSSTW